MAQDKAKLEKLISFIEHICNQKGNEWFKKAINEKTKSKKLMLPDDENSPFENNTSQLNESERIKQIHEYLKLNVGHIIDYTGIIEEHVKNQLTADCIEMGRYRLGIVNDRIQFDEFCRYAHLQAEGLINYFLYIRYDKSISKLVEGINSGISKDEFKLNAIKVWDISSISYSVKLSHIHRTMNLVNFETFLQLDFLAKFRNQLSHRSPVLSKTEENLIEKYNEAGLKYGEYVDFTTLTPEQKKIREKAIIPLEKKAQDFNKYTLTIESLKFAVLKNLEDPNYSAVSAAEKWNSLIDKFNSKK